MYSIFLFQYILISKMNAVGFLCALVKVCCAVVHRDGNRPTVISSP